MEKFHLRFDYESAYHHQRVVGHQIVIKETLEEAVQHIAQQRGLSRIHIRDRLLLGKPPSEAEVIDRNFDFQKDAAR